ncbi:MAG: DNA-directed RNA polymerase subunit A' [Candidatus Aenigmatarchaeota archaeon]|nr:MAG: DNA-directed RNA polymerase subunit A' [Candidatus Aenigmarchaeota archaeon]
MVSKIKTITFSILSPEMIKSIATVRIVTSDLYDVDGYPVEGGVMDPRLGVVDPGLHCRTCGGGIGDCPGHFGYLELAKPVVNILYTKAIYKLLKISCKKCGRVLSKEGDKKSSKELGRNPPSKCPHCNENQGKIKFLKPSTFYMDKEELSPEEIREWFERIPEENLKRVGFRGGRPESLLLTLFPVSPVTTRPSITLESGEKSEDDLTHKLVDIVRINQSLRENIDIGAPDFIIKDLWELLQYHITTYFDNELTGIPQARHRSGRPLKGMIQRMKGKEGRIRGNLLGKRVNFSARTVISPDPRISINEVGVPDIIANELTIEVPVTKLNKREVKDIIKSDKSNYAKRPDGRRIKISPENKKEIIDNINEDWVIDRQLRDGDVVLFNRQPSLHRPSIMAHRVRVMPYKTFRISPQVCPPYNADFDGDEMNLHALQTEESRVEAAELIDVKNNILSPRFGGPLIGNDLDQISGIYLLTKGNQQFTKKETLELFSRGGIRIELPDGKDSFTGKEIFSLLLPKGLSLEFKSSCCEQCEKCIREDCEFDCWVKIKDGELVQGTIDAAAVGAFKGKIISRMHGISDMDEIREFIDNCGRLAVAYIAKRGFSIGISDLDLSDDIMHDVRKRVIRAESNSNNLIEKYNKRELDILPGLTAVQSLETQILNVLAQGLNDVSEIVKDKIGDGDLLVMANSGAKGSLINITQMAACVGQEAILGQRIKRGYFNRTLPHFKKGDLSAAGHGFVRRGFKQELSPTELFWNIMNGREGLMDKSLRTRKSGYMQRRLVNALQDLRINPKLSVKNSNGHIIQFVAGEDGIDPSKSEWGDKG